MADYAVSAWYKKYDAVTPSHQKTFYVIYSLDAPVKAFRATIDAATGEVLHTYSPESMPLG